MKLSKLMQDIPEDTLLYIGAGANYFFIGTKDDFESAFDGINKKFRDLADKLLKLYLYDRFKIQNRGLMFDVNVMFKSKIHKWCDATAFSKHRLDVCDRMIVQTKEYIENYIPVEEREVEDVRRRRFIEPGIIIILEGNEQGNMWFKHEYDERKLFYE